MVHKIVHQLWSFINTVSEKLVQSNSMAFTIKQYASQSHKKMYLLSCSLPLNMKALQVVILFDFDIFLPLLQTLMLKTLAIMYHFCALLSILHCRSLLTTGEAKSRDLF